MTANGSNLGSMFVILDGFHERHAKGQSARQIATQFREACVKQIEEAQINVFGAPPVDGLGSAGGFKLMIEDRGDNGTPELQRQTDKMIAAGNQQPKLLAPFTISRSNTPQLYIDVDRTKCMAMGVPIGDVFQTLQVYLGSLYVNDFNLFGRTWQVNLQADARPCSIMSSRHSATGGGFQLERRSRLDVQYQPASVRVGFEIHPRGRIT